MGSRLEDERGLRVDVEIYLLHLFNGSAKLLATILEERLGLAASDLRGQRSGGQKSRSQLSAC